MLTIFFGVMYTLSGAISYQFGTYLPMHSLEKSVPFWTWTIWIYIILYPIYLVWALWSYQDENQMNKTLYGFLLLTLISCALFIIFPISYPREAYILPLNNDLTTLIFRGMRSLDKPSNCLPSLHVGLCYLFAYGFKNESRKKFLISLFISTLVALSTLTTKQHYTYDLIAGFFLASGIYFFLDKYTQVSSHQALSV
ncbi:MAG: phosphatase PAP2 family protein [Bacteriovoracaceae bacterium]|nr:phosphatase PAP2 family protein [Bacteriovoracaceae bacterium]